VLAASSLGATSAFGLVLNAAPPHPAWQVK
jgi:hypothetical protein